MASNFQSSFIPKGPITEEVFKKKKTSILDVLAVSLFIISIIASAGMYFYKSIVKKDIQNLESQLALAEKNIDKANINEMAKFGKKLKIVKSIVSKHQVVSNFLATLSSSTVSSVQFTEFGYDGIKNDALSVTLRGKAANYASIALQENVLSQNKYFRSTDFSNLSLSDKGMVSFDLRISVDPKISAYDPQLSI